MELNKIYNENCLETLKRMHDSFIDLTVTSPPYDNLRTYNGYTFDFEGIAKELYRVTKDGGVVVWIVGDATIKGSETGTSFKQALYFKEIGFNLYDTMIYSKPNAPLSHRRYEQDFEYMFVLCKGTPNTFNGIKDKINKYSGTSVSGSKRDVGTGIAKGLSGRKLGKVIQKYGLRGNIWRYSNSGGLSTKDSFAHQHPAIFPEKLAEDHILSWSNEGDIVLDPMCGSGTTLKMAKKNNRNYIGIEISQEYIEIINKRLENL